MLDLKLYSKKTIKMNTWLSDTKPLLSLILPFLKPCEQQNWRMAGSFAKTMSDRHIAPLIWKEIVLNQPNVKTCSICSQIHVTSNMFYCSVCSNFTCGNHVMSCKVCMYDLCAKCAIEMQCNMCHWPEFSVHYS